MSLAIGATYLQESGRSGGAAPTLTTTGSKADLFGFIQTDTDEYDGVIIGQNV